MDLVCINHFRQKFDYCVLPNGKYRLGQGVVPSLCIKTSDKNIQTMPESPKAQDIISDNKVQFVEVKIEAPDETKSENIKLKDCEDKMINPEQVVDLISESCESNNIKVNEINENVHNDTKKYKCDQCQKSFTTTRNLKQHIDYICITKQGAIRDEDLVTKVQEGTKETKKAYEKKRHCCVPFCDSYLMKGLFTFPKEDSMKQGP